MPHSPMVSGVPGFWGFLLGSLHVLLLSTWVLSGSPKLLPQSKEMPLRCRSIGDSNFTCECECEFEWSVSVF